MKMENKSGLAPLGRAVLCVPYDPEYDSTILAIPDYVKARRLMEEMRATVLEVGPLAWNDEPEPRAKPGDKVLISKFTGAIVQGPDDGKLYRLCNGEDIFCGIKGEMDNVVLKDPKRKPVTQLGEIANG